MQSVQPINLSNEQWIAVFLPVKVSPLIFFRKRLFIYSSAHFI